MKNTTLNLAFLFIGIICLLSCKKKDKDKEEEPLVPPIVTDSPPATGDYWLTCKNNNIIYWTQDFVSYHELSTALKGDLIFLCGDTVLFTGYQDHSIKYGPVSNPVNFKTVSSSRVVLNAAYVNGYIVALSVDGNNKYIGYCNTKKGETAIQYTFLNNGESFSGFYKIRNSVLTNFSTSLGTTLAFSSFSNDSLKWMLAPSPAANGSFQYFDGGSNVTVAYSAYYYKTQATDFKTATWAFKNISNENTSDSSGAFGAYEVYNRGFVNINNKWKVYGMISMTSNGHKINAVNTSGDQGGTWQTALLTGFPYAVNGGQNFTYRCLVSKNTTFITYSNNAGSNSIAYVYKSTDGVNFTKILEGVEAQNIYEQSQGAVYIK